MVRIASSSLVCVLALLAAGCKNDPRRQLQGKWVGERVESFPPTQAARAEGWAASMSMAFEGRRVSIAIPAEAPRTGDFEVTKAQEGALTLAFVRPDGSRDTADFQFEQDRLRWQLGDGRSVIFRKAQD